MTDWDWPVLIKKQLKTISPTTELNQNYIYAYADPTMMVSIAYGKLAVLAMNHMIVIFDHHQLVLLEIRLDGSLSGEVALIPYSDIKETKLKKKWSHDKLIIALKGELNPLVLKINHKPNVETKLGMTWQKDHLDYLKNKNWNNLSKKTD